MTINTDLHVAAQLILLYLDIDSENHLKELITGFGQVLSKHSLCEVVPYSKQLHLTLACQFNFDHKRALEELATKHIDYKENWEWEIRLYSRDARLDEKNVGVDWTILQARNFSNFFPAEGFQSCEHSPIQIRQYNRFQIRRLLIHGHPQKQQVMQYIIT